MISYPTTTANYAHPLNQGLVGWWKNLPTLRGGNTAHDLSSSKVDCARVGNAGFSGLAYPGGFGSWSFDATVGDNFKNVALSKEIINSDLSSTGWVNPAAVGGYRGYFGFRADADGDFYILQLSGSNQLECRLRGTTGIANATPNPTVSANTWQFIAMTYDRITLRVYVNGVQKASVAYTASITNAAADFYIGADKNNNAHDGFIDDVRLYNRALTATEVRQLYVLNQQRGSRLLVTVSRRRVSSALPASYFDGRISRFTLAKPTDASAQVSDFVLDTHNSGKGVLHSALDAAQKTAWGMAVWHNLMEASGSGLDQHASKDLTDNNTVTAADGPAILSPPDIEADGNLIVEWRSKEGSSYQFQQATAAKRPTAAMGANGINSEIAVEFDGTKILIVESAPLQGATTLTLVIPWEQGSTAFSGDQAIFATSDDTVDNEYFVVGPDGSGKFYVEVNDGGVIYRATGDTLLVVSTKYVATIRDTGAALEIEIDGVLQTLTEIGTYKGIGDLTGLNRTALGGLPLSAGDTDFFEGKLPESIVYAPTLVDTAESQNESYVNSRYAI